MKAEELGRHAGEARRQPFPVGPRGEDSRRRGMGGASGRAEAVRSAPAGERAGCQSPLADTHVKFKLKL